MTRTSDSLHRRTDESPTAKIRTSCQALLDTSIHGNPSILFACLGTVDGRLVASAASNTHSSPQNLSAMTSSLLALSESFVKEALRSSCSFTLVSTLHGAIVTVRVPSESRTYALSIGADTSQVIAMTLRATLDMADDVAKLIDAAMKT